MRIVKNGVVLIHPNNGEYIAIDFRGTITFTKNNVGHRENNKPYTITPGIYLEWMVEGELHRENGPAKIWPDGQKDYFINGRWKGTELW